MTASSAFARTVRARSAWSPEAIVLGVMSWITLVLAIDAHAGEGVQRGLGAATWLALALVLLPETALARTQAMVVVVFATAVEYTFSPVLGVYLYRFDNVPAYVPPGHGLVYVAALAIGRIAFVRSNLRLCVAASLTAVGGYAAYGVLVADRADLLGAFWFLCLAGFFLWGPSRSLYVGAAIVVTYLEIVGTSLGTWEWQPRDPTGLVPIGNPPSGAAGGYGWFDLAALVLAPRILAGLSYVRGRSPRATSRAGASPRRAATVNPAAAASQD